MRKIKVSSSIRKEQERNQVDRYLQGLIGLVRDLDNLLLYRSRVVPGNSRLDLLL